MAMSKGKMCGALAGLRIRTAVVMTPTHRTPAFAKSSRLEFAEEVTRITAAKTLWFHNKGELVKPIGVTWSRCVQGSTHVHRASSCSASLRMGCTARFGPHTFLGADLPTLVDPFGVTKDSQRLHRQKVAAVAAAVISSGSHMQLANNQMARLGIQHAMLVSASMGMVAVCLQVDASSVADWILAGTWAQTMPATIALFGLSDLMAQTIEKR
jgi:hypothetical protein